MMMVIMMAEEQTNHTVVAFDPPQSAAVDIKVERFQRACCCAIKMLAVCGRSTARCYVTPGCLPKKINNWVCASSAHSSASTAVSAAPATSYSVNYETVTKWSKELV